MILINLSKMIGILLRHSKISTKRTLGLMASTLLIGMIILSLLILKIKKTKEDRN